MDESETKIFKKYPMLENYIITLDHCKDMIKKELAKTEDKIIKSVLNEYLQYLENIKQICMAYGVLAKLIDSAGQSKRR